jgi:xylan 1,4-beta-xylosidase
MKQTILLLMAALAISYALNAQNRRTIDVDFDREAGSLSRTFNECIGAGRANEGLRADWQTQLRQTQMDCGFRYIRMHGLFCDDMGVYFEDSEGNSIYNWQYIDQLYDFLVDIKMKPFIELSFMPGALASGDKTIFWWKGNVTPPKSYDKWFAFIKAFTEHITQRYGEDEVKTWYFEVWNEPNLKDAFFTGTRDEYFKLYRYTAKAVKEVNADYKVGGPATAGNQWIKEMIGFCSQNNVPIDFISTHTYGVGQGFLDEKGQRGTVLVQDKKAIINDVEYAHKVIANSSMPNLELHYTEWSTSYTPSDPIHDSYHSAAFILDKLKNTESIVNSMSYWVFTDIFEEAGPRYTPFHGGFGLLNYQSVKKPAYFAYEFLNQLGDVELKNEDKASWVCKNRQGDITSLLWDFTLTSPIDSVNNQVYYKRDLPSQNRGTAEIKFTNVPEGEYQLKITMVGYRNNDAYATYMQLGSPNQLTQNQVNVIKELNSGVPSVNEIIRISDQKRFHYTLPMRENDVYFIQLLKI